MSTAAPATESLRIVSLEVSAFKRLRAVRIKPEGDVVQITGRNGQGKSSVLDAIAAAIGGGHNAPDRPIRKGNKRAEIRVDLGEMVVERTFTEKGSAVTVTAKDGGELKSPQAVLDRLYGSIAFDPLEFTRMPPRAQVDTLKRLTGKEAEFAELDAKKAEAVKARTEAARQVKMLELQVAALPDTKGPDDEVSLATLVERANDAQRVRTENEKARRWFAGKQDEHRRLLERIAELDKEIAAARKTLAGVHREIEDNEPEIKGLVDPDIAEIQAEIQNVEARNAVARQRRARREAVAKLEKARETERAEARRVECLEADRENALASAKLPVPGLGFTEDGVTFNGVPFDQASTAEQVRASVAMGMAANPRLRVMLVREGSLLDRDSMRLLAEMAAEYDAQFWVERVSDGEKVGITIEDGEVAEGGVA